LEQDRRTFVLVRRVLRTLLGGYLGLDTGRLCFCYGPHGKLASTWIQEGSSTSTSHTRAISSSWPSPVAGRFASTTNACAQTSTSRVSQPGASLLRRPQRSTRSPVRRGGGPLSAAGPGKRLASRLSAPGYRCHQTGSMYLLPACLWPGYSSLGKPVPSRALNDYRSWPPDLDTSWGPWPRKNATGAQRAGSGPEVGRGARTDSSRDTQILSDAATQISGLGGSRRPATLWIQSRRMGSILKGRVAIS
jgi:hypothetical protein